MKHFSFSYRQRIGALLAVATFGITLSLARLGATQGITTQWSGYGHDPQHSAQGTTAPTPVLSRIKWQTSMDLNPQFRGNDLLIHYGSPAITRANTVILPVKTGATDGFRIEGRSGTDGTLKWTINTDYTLPPHGWVPSCGVTLTPRGGLYVPGAGGTVLYYPTPDTGSGTITPTRLAFYGIGNYNTNPTGFNGNIQISTPITSDRYGNIYFGFYTTGNDPLGLKSGLARISYQGVGTYVTSDAASGDSAMSKVVTNCAPALSNDHRTLYFAVNNGSYGYLVALDSTTLARKASVRLKDVVNTVNDAWVNDDGTASPVIAPNGDVFYGVLENPFSSNHLRGWLLHFDSTLSTAKTPGAFGWDDTPSIVPSAIVPSYTGTSSYLLMAKYNNYVDGSGDGVNKVAILDPDAASTDPISGAQTMQEVMSHAGVTPDTDKLAGHPNAVREWCINSAAVDIVTKSALVNNEDGKLYRWDFTDNQLKEAVTLTQGVGEAYTPTLVGPDGTVYAINNATLFAVGQ